MVIKEQLLRGFGGIRFPHVKGSDPLSFKGYLQAVIRLASFLSYYDIKDGAKHPCAFKRSDLQSLIVISRGLVTLDWQNFDPVRLMIFVVKYLFLR
jgi:hypothetical protein